MYENDDTGGVDDYSSYSDFSTEEVIDLIGEVLAYTTSEELINTLSAARDRLESQESYISELEERLNNIHQELSNIDLG